MKSIAEIQALFLLTTVPSVDMALGAWIGGINTQMNTGGRPPKRSIQRGLLSIFTARFYHVSSFFKKVHAGPLKPGRSPT